MVSDLNTSFQNTSFQNGSCDYPSRRCWYKHVGLEQQIRVVEESQEKESSQPQDFWQLPNPMKPPEGEVLELKGIMRRAMKIISSVNQNVETLLL